MQRVVFRFDLCHGLWSGEHSSGGEKHEAGFQGFEQCHHVSIQGSSDDKHPAVKKPIDKLKVSVYY